MSFKRDYLSDRSEESLLAEIRRVATQLGKHALTQAEFNKNARISSQVIKKRFGTWNKALAKSGLNVTKRMNVPDEEILAELGRVWTLLGHRPTQDEFDKLSTIGSPLLKKRYGGVLKAVERYVALQSKGASPVAITTLPVDVRHTTIQGSRGKRRANQRYGSLINFRGMQHAAMNELGVVFLFGMLAKELGFVVEAISADFPDCEAKRLDEKGAFWVKVAIEFEYKSSSFVQHAHDPAQCDLIVCWVHDWKDCPIDVLELSSVVKKASE